MSDMIMDESQYQALVGGGEEKAKAVRGFRNGIPVPLKHWDEGIVPYVFDGSVGETTLFKKIDGMILSRSFYGVPWQTRSLRKRFWNDTTR